MIWKYILTDVHFMALNDTKNLSSSKFLGGTSILQMIPHFSLGCKRMMIESSPYYSSMHVILYVGLMYNEYNLHFSYVRSIFPFSLAFFKFYTVKR